MIQKLCILLLIVCFSICDGSQKVSNCTLDIHLAETRIICTNITIGAFNQFLDSLEITSVHRLVFVDSTLGTLDSTTFNHPKIPKLGFKEVSITNGYIDNVKQQSFQKFSSLQSLILDRNHISSLAAGSFMGPNIVNLSLDNNALTYIDKTMFSYIDRVLSFLSLSGNNLTEIDKSTFASFQRLVFLNLSDNALQELPREAFESATLTTLDLSRCKLTTLQKTTFKKLPSLSKLYMSYNKIDTIQLGAFEGITSLTVLDLHRNVIRKFAYGVFSNLKMMYHLDLSYNWLYALDARWLFPLKSLTYLNINGNSVRDLNMNQLLEFLPKLQLMRLYGNRWECDDLTPMLFALERKNIEYLEKDMGTYDVTNVNGIVCNDEIYF